jgi:TonB family protein
MKLAMTLPRTLALAALFAGCAVTTSGTLLPVANFERTSCAGKPVLDTLVYDTTAVNERPAIHQLDLLYPPEARERRVRDSVVVVVVVKADGSVDLQSITLLQPARSEYATLFDSSAVQSIRYAAFWPACRGDHPVGVRVKVPLRWAVQ